MIKVFDGHADIWNDVVNKRSQGETRVIERYHLEKFKKGGVFSGIFVVWVDTPFDNPARRFWQTVDAMTAELDENAGILRPVRTSADFSKAAEQGQFPIVLGLEGLDGLEGDLSILKAMYEKGFRHTSLTWNTENAFGTGVKGNPEHGLTDLGLSALRFMESSGMIVDVSHANEKLFWDIERSTHRPFIASHSNCKAICDVPRNLTDDQIKAIARRGGVIGMVAYHEFISRDPKKQSLETYAEHIQHIADLVGIDHVGLGFDFVDYLDDDAMSSFATETAVTRGLESALQAGDVGRILSDKGFNREDIEKVCSGNFLRVIKEIIS